MMYEIVRLRDSVDAFLLDDGGQRLHKVKHLMYHSPDGFEYGYAGSGPSDLARSILGDYLHRVRDKDYGDPVEAPPADYYQRFKMAFIAPLDIDEDRHEIEIADIETWFDEGVVK